MPHSRWRTRAGGLASVVGATKVQYKYGGEGNDDILDGAGTDVVRGGNGNDWFGGYNGNDKFYGEAGNDRLDGREQGEIDSVVDLMDGSTHGIIGDSCVARTMARVTGCENYYAVP